MTFPRARFWLGLLLLALATGFGHAADLRNRSTSRSGQFIVYSADRELRMRVASYAEELKDDMLQLLRSDDGWSEHKINIIVSLLPPDPAQPVSSVVVQWVNTPGGAKIDVIARVGSDPSTVFLQRHLLRAMLLEMSFRQQPEPKAGEPYLMPPWWLVEGIIENLRQRGDGEDRDVFKSIVNTQKLPALDKWLQQPPMYLDTAAGAVDRACAMCLVDTLLNLPGGANSLQRFIAVWPASGGDALGALTAQYPSLAGSEQSLAKWWTLQLARYANGDRLQGLTLADTDRALSALLSFEIVLDKAGHTEKFAIQDFPRFVKVPAARNVLRALQVKIVTLQTKANPILRPVLEEYEQICSLLSIGKTRKIAERIHDIEQYRQGIVQRIGQITDYLNWYEATQPVGRTGLFTNYLKQAERYQAPVPVDPRITAYLDSLEEDFAPYQPTPLPQFTHPSLQNDTAVIR